MKRFIRGFVLLTLVAAMVVGLLPALGKVAAQEKTVITFWNGFTGPDRPAMEELVRQFNESQDEIEIEMTIMPWDSLYQTLLGALSAGEGPDIIGVNFNYVPVYASSGYVTDLTPYLEEGSNLDPALWPESLVNLLQYDGKFYAVPINFATLMMYYNKDLFEQAGLDPENPPATWDEWIEALRTLTGEGVYGIALGERQTIPNWPILLWGTGGDLVIDGESALNSPETLEALNIWGPLVRDEGVSPFGLTGAEADQLFQTGRAAMGITGPWMVNGFLEAGVNFDVAPIPEGPAGPVTLADSVVFMVTESSPNKEAAIEFIDFWNSRDAQLYWSQETGFPPARLDLADDPELFEANEWAAKFASVVPYSRFFLGGQPDYVQIENDIFVPMIQSITQNVTSIEEAAALADEQLDALLADNSE
jgi:multiple sugar transport system substrate-binding protein